MSEREKMISRIREALGYGKPVEAQRPAQERVLPPSRLEGVMPPTRPEGLLAKFEAELGKVSGIPHRAAGTEELEEILRGILDAAQATEVVLSRNPLLARLGLAERLRASGKTVAEWPSVVQKGIESSPAFREACFSAAVGITGVEWALAETGSVVLTSRTEGSQLASLAQPVHIALYQRQQLLESLDDVLERLPAARGENIADGRSVVFVTGVSRTADIEQILIRGVHGPRELHAILIEESCGPAAHSEAG